MLFQNDEASLKLEILRYEFPEGAGDPASDDRNWLVLRATYTEGDRRIVDSNSCLLTYELREMAAGLKVLNAGVRDQYESSFVEPFFELSAAAEGDGFTVDVSFVLPNTMEDLDAAELECLFSRNQMKELLTELDGLCQRYPDRK